MWRDPLDELIEDLERATPAVATNGPEALAELLRYTDVILYGSDDARRRLEADPRFHRFMAAMARRANPGEQ